MLCCGMGDGDDVVDGKIEQSGGEWKVQRLNIKMELPPSRGSVFSAIGICLPGGGLSVKWHMY